MEENYYTITIENPDGTYSGYTANEEDPRIQSYLKKMEVLYYRDRIGDNETIHKINDDGLQ